MHLPLVRRLCAVLALGLTLSAQAADIDFEGTVAPILYAATAPLRDLYSPLSVRFEGTDGNGGSILNQFAELGFQAHSGTDFLAFNRDVAVGSGTGERIVFSTGQNSVSIFAASYEEGSFSLSAYDANNSLLGSTSVATSRYWSELSFSATGIRSIVVNSNVGGWGLDDLSTQAAPVPEPATFGMLGVGLAVVLAARRKRRA